MRTLAQDARYALRNLSRARGFATVVILTLALGIGANTAIFSIVNSVVLRPLAYPESQQLVRITSALRTLGADDTGVASQELFDYQALTDVFDGVAGLYPVNANVTGGDQPERVEVMLVSANYFSILKGEPQLGRVFGPEDNGPGIPEVAIASDGYWRRRLGADPNAIGRTLMVDGDPFVLVGVMPPEFTHPGWTVQTEVDLWSPAGYRAMPFGEPNRTRRFLSGAIARLKPGVTLAQAQTRLDAYGADVRQRFSADYPTASGWNPKLVSVQNDVVGNVETPMLILLGAVGLVLLIVCANVAHLVLARSAERQQEMAIRQALGASGGRLTRQLLTESAILATAGAAVGLLLASWGTQALVRLAPRGVPRLSEIAMDWSSIGITAVLAGITTVLFGLVPAWQIRRTNTFAIVKEGGQGRSAAVRGAKARSVLVTAEVALAMVLLVGAGLLIRSVGELLDVPLGFQTQDLLTSRIWLPRPNDNAKGVYLTHEKRLEFYRATLSRVSALPGVEKAAMSTQVPMGGWRAPLFYEAEGRDLADQNVRPVIQQFQVSPSYFETLGIPVVRGRAFSDLDRAGGEQVVLISESAARSIWPNDNPIGKRVRFSTQMPWMTVIGVAGDVRNRRLEETPAPILYRSLEQSSGLELALLVRTRAEAAGLAESIAREVRSVDPELPLYSVRTMEELVSGAVAQRRFLMRILAAFGATAVGLALLGIYGVISYSVSQRTREIGIRMAIGAQQRDVSRMVVRHGLTLTAIGAGIGLAGALGLSQLIKSQLFGVKPSDPLTLGTVVLVMALVATGAAWLPARRAARVDPIIALRRE